MSSPSILVLWYQRFVFTTMISPGLTMAFMSPWHAHQHSGGGRSNQVLVPDTWTNGWIFLFFLNTFCTQINQSQFRKDYVILNSREVAINHMVKAFKIWSQTQPNFLVLQCSWQASSLKETCQDIDSKRSPRSVNVFCHREWIINQMYDGCNHQINPLYFCTLKKINVKVLKSLSPKSQIKVPNPSQKSKIQSQKSRGNGLGLGLTL